MKGVVFVEFLEMVESELGLDETEKLIEDSNLESGGAYTTVGTYDDNEMLTLVKQFHARTNIPIPVLLRRFGEYLFNNLIVKYKEYMKDFDSGFDLLKQIDNYIHVEVQKLYPKAILPKFTYDQPKENTLRLTYESDRKLSDLAEGLIVASMKHFDEKFTIKQELIHKDKSKVLFIITKY